MLKAAWHFRSFLRPYRLPLGIGAVLVVLDILAALAQPWPLKVIIDGAISHKRQPGWLPSAIVGSATGSQGILLRALAVLAALVVLSAVLGFLSDYLMSGAGQRVMLDVRTALFAHMQRLSLSYHSHQRVGDLTGRLSVDINRLQDMLVAIFDTLIPNAVMLCGLGIVMVAVDPGFGLLALAIAPPLFVVTYSYTLRIKRASRRAREAEAGVAAHANETLGAVHVVQAFSREQHEDDRFATRSREALHAGLAAIRLKAAFTPMVDVVSVFGTIAVTYFGVQRVLHGRMTLGLLLVFLAYLSQLYKPMRALSKLAYLVSQGTISAERVLETFQNDQQLPQPRAARKLTRVAGSVELREVTFRYTPAQRPILDRVSIRVDPGERIGVVGPSGVGKSTFVSLIPRFYDPERGAVLIDGIDVRSVDLPSLRSQVSLVLQEPVLFYGSILENIRYGDPQAHPKRIHAAAEAANVLEFTDGLRDGLETQIGERGVMLSGGQRQRIAIARAMLRNAPILILDEPTTGLDAEAGRLVIEGLARLAEGRTTFVISHHAGPLAGVHRIVTLPHHGDIQPEANPATNSADLDSSPTRWPQPVATTSGAYAERP